MYFYHIFVAEIWLPFSSLAFSRRHESSMIEIIRRREKQARFETVVANTAHAADWNALSLRDSFIVRIIDIERLRNRKWGKTEIRKSSVKERRASWHRSSLLLLLLLRHRYDSRDNFRFSPPCSDIHTPATSILELLSFSTIHPTNCQRKTVPDCCRLKKEPKKHTVGYGGEKGKQR